MTSTIVVKNKHGLHLRAAVRLVLMAKAYDCPILVKNKEKSANANSIFELLNLAAPEGTELEIEADGTSAEQAIKAIQGLAKAKFGESE